MRLWDEKSMRADPSLLEIIGKGVPHILDLEKQGKTCGIRCHGILQKENREIVLILCGNGTPLDNFELDF